MTHDRRIDATSLYSVMIPTVEAEDLLLTRLYAADHFAALFVERATTVIGAAYDDITVRFAENLVRVDRAGWDDRGYFTLGKDIWVATSRDGQLVGFVVFTRKRGGSVKLGPTLLEPNAQGRGRAATIIEALLGLYQRVGVRKVYVTAPLQHDAATRLDFAKLRLSVEAVLRSHYTSGGAERVSGRLLGPSSAPSSVDTHVAEDALAEVNFTTDGAYGSEFSAFMLSEMAGAYADIDDGFTSAVVDGAGRGPDAAYEDKGKIVIRAWCREELVAVAVCTPKRGGALKVAPLLIRRDCRSILMTRLMLDAIRNAAAGHRKLLLLVPTVHWGLVRLLFNEGLAVEGFLREPYHAGCDVVVLAQFI